MRRGRIDIISEILSVASDGVGKTALVYRTNLNFHIVGKYVETLSKEGLISESRNSPVRYRTTSRGTEFLRAFDGLKKIEKVQ